MAVLTKSQTPSSHWYTVDGEAVHQMDAANGNSRPTDLRDAKKYGLFPSVTGIISIFAKPTLETWKLKQVAIAALNNPITKDESEDYYVKRVIENAFAQVDRAADFGTLCHLAIELNIKEGRPIPVELQPYLNPVLEIINGKGMHISASEKTVVNTRFGFAGAMDFSFVYGKNQDKLGVIDFKTRKTKAGVPVESYPFQDMQIAAYAATYWAQKLGITEEEALARCIGANVFISSTEVGRVEVVKYTAEQLLSAFPVFTSACRMWRHIKSYDPRNAERAPVPVPIPPVEIKAEDVANVPSDVVAQVDVSDVDTIFEEGDKKRAAKAKPKANAECKACGGSGKSSKGSACVCTTKASAKPVATPKAKDDPKETKEKPKKTKPIILATGKHKGKALEDVPVEYLTWMTSQKAHRDDKKLMAAIELILRGK